VVNQVSRSGNVLVPLVALILLFPLLAASKMTSAPELNDRLLSAAFHGRQEEVGSLIAQGANVNTHDPGDGSTPLIIATQRDHARLVSFLLQKGASVHEKDDSGFTPLIYATKAPIAKALIDKGADVNARGLEKMTPLIKASAGGLAELVKVLLDAGADVNARDLGGKTALIEATDNGFPEIVGMLLRKRADPNAADGTGRTALMHAVVAGRSDLVKTLLEAGADPNLKNHDENSALMFAIGNAPIAALLLDKGAEINMKCGGDDTTVLMRAAARGELRLAELLLARGAEIHARDKHGRTALQLAEKYGHRKLANLLKSHGATE
jgi:ankyrin repeat protein